MRRRKRDRHLPPCVYFKHGAYYYVRRGKWIRLGDNLADSLARYSRLITQDKGDMVGLIDKTIEDARSRGCKKATMDGYERAGRYLREAMVEFAVDEVRPEHIRAIMDHWRGKPNMANRMRSLLMQAFSSAVQRGMRETNPVREIPRFDESKRTRYVTDAEWEAIYAKGSPALRCIMDVAYFTAQRIGDVLKIRQSDVSEDGIYIEQQKTGKRLRVRMTPPLRDAVNRCRSLHSTTPMYLLGQRNGRIRSYWGVQGLLKRAADAAGVEDVGWHDIRAKSLTDANRQGRNAQKLAGHSTEAQTNRYIRARETEDVEGPDTMGDKSGANEKPEQG